VRYRRFSDCSVSEKLLDSLFILTLSAGYLLAMVLILAVVAPLDGNPGLSVKDIELKYYGNRSGTRLEAAMKGPMKVYHSLPEHEKIVQWIYAGATERDYTEKVKPIFDEKCVRCHNPDSGLEIPDLTTYGKIKPLAETDIGISIGALARVSHIHLFGIGLLFYLLGRIFILAEMPVWLKRSIVAVPFVSIALDIGSWWLTKYIPVFAYAVIAGGVLMGISFAVQALTSLYQMWFYRPKGTQM
jgi:hypothetical protein